jgi:hypothetical protein
MYASPNIVRAAYQADQAAFVAALDRAHARSFHSYFTQYVLTDDDAGYIAVDEGDYGALPRAMMDRVVDTVPTKLTDEF